jgi:hypothetical protein
MAGKAAAPRVSLGTLFLSVQFADALWPLLLLLGLEHVHIVPNIMRTSHLNFWDYPISHSLLALCVWGILFGVVFFLARRSLAAAVLLAVGVVSHWVLDLVTHRSDLPILPHGPYVGLGLWDSLPGTLAAEIGLFAAGAAVYVRVTRARDAAGVWALWSLLLLLLGIWLASLFGPPPPSEGVLAWTALSGWLFVPWGYWIDRHRTVRSAGAVPA